MDLHNESVNISSLGEESNKSDYLFHNIGISANILLFTLIFTTNIMILVVVRSTSSMDSVTGIVMSSLAVCDLLLGSQILLGSVNLIYERLMFGNVLCKASNVIISVSLGGSLYMITLMSVDRYILIIHPLRYEQILTN